MRPALKLGSKNSKLHIFQLPSFAIMLSATFFILDAKHETKLEPFILSHTLAIHPYQSIMFCLVLTAVLFSFLSAARSIFPRVLLFFLFFLLENDYFHAPFINDWWSLLTTASTTRPSRKRVGEEKIKFWLKCMIILIIIVAKSQLRCSRHDGRKSINPISGGVWTDRHG